MSITTRFAPRPTGPLHLGRARDAGGRFLLRIEDIDAARCRPEHAEAVVSDILRPRAGAGTRERPRYNT